VTELLNAGGAFEFQISETTKRRHRRLERSTPKGVRPGGRSTADPADDKIGTRSWHGLAPSCFIFSNYNGKLDGTEGFDCLLSSQNERQEADHRSATVVVVAYATLTKVGFVYAM
jgi:hypothetical protein